ncbi:hypothetical protein LAJ19_16710 (plasmid) [Deinococcus taeanensis]|uniref:hypothetical protein n=1 Tax=Deinococcus taeanensis TaxID=2737050 RepID=UPI001CDBFF98|nr:hypothetical protein [Deinococcus taeanensis]UBV44785.1 hypothetical protein LAJ19_16710 [Deinococcus taeanensis]
MTSTNFTRPTDHLDSHARARKFAVALGITAGLGLTACAPKDITVNAWHDFPGRKYCEVPGGTLALGTSVSDKALTKIFNTGCWLYDRQDFTFMSDKDVSRMYRMFGGKVENAGSITGISGLSLMTRKLSLAQSTITLSPDVQEQDMGFYYTGSVMRALFRDGGTLSAATTMTGVQPVELNDAGRRVVITGEGPTLVRDLYSAPVEAALRGLQTFVWENLQGGAQTPGRHRVQTGLPAGSVVALIMRLKDTKIMGRTDPVFAFEVAVVQPNGWTEFSASFSHRVRVKPGPEFTVKRLHLKASVNALRTAKSETPQDVDAAVIPVSGVPLGEIGQTAIAPVNPESTVP